MWKLSCLVLLGSVLFFANGMNLDFAKISKELKRQQYSGRADEKNNAPENENTHVDGNQVDSFVLKLTSALTKRVQRKLTENHELSPTEVKLLEFFIKMIKDKKRDRDVVNSEETLGRNANPMQERTFHERKKTDLVEDFANENKRNINQIDDELRSMVKKLLDSRAEKQKIVIDEEENGYDESIAKHNQNEAIVHHNEVEKKKNGVNQLLEKMLDDYVKKLKKEQEEKMKDERARLHEKVLNNILSLVTKEREEEKLPEQNLVQEESITGRNNNVTEPSNEKRGESHKIILHVDAAFAKEFWKKLGADKKEDESKDDENGEMSKKAILTHCTQQPQTDCRRVCLISSCKEICLETTKELCMNI